MEIDYKILNLYKTKQYDKCLNLCATALQNKSDRMLEFIQMRAMTIQAKVAGNGYEEVEYFPKQDDLVTTAVAKTPRAGTAFQREVKTAQQLNKRTSGTATSRGVSTSRAPSTRAALHTASRLSRAATALAGGAPFTASTPLSLRFLTKEDTLFVPAAKTLFEYVYYCEGDIRKAMDIAFQAQKSTEIIDWWWNFSLARCYSALGMHRNTEDCLRQALKQNKHISIYLRLVAMYVGLNQPLSALEVCKQGLSIFHEYTPLLLEQARIHDEMGNPALAVKEYRMVALEDPSNMEAIASIAMYNFYNDQPEIALRYYRRLLATNNPGPEIFNNLGLCCLYCNQWDLILPCFRQALYFSANAETRSDIWFNLSHVALSTGDMALARRCLQVSLATNSENEASKNALCALNAQLRVRR
ncbi:tetratricopeptide repeat protein 8-like [Galleria mellonella]|uniref:Tetratricopeptide repeat protein 8 n=1 Tax=Galleria mellonella TaxID=7137 RepID=A0A6J3BS29_GALME|nr:tetratricopeptide repeat protein 8 [Galleria mellonella]XP_052756132.1 tetratricopeptide repeat protein 8-like [Galleria mellonella]